MVHGHRVIYTQQIKIMYWLIPKEKYKVVQQHGGGITLTPFGTVLIPDEVLDTKVGGIPIYSYLQYVAGEDTFSNPDKNFITGGGVNGFVFDTAQDYIDYLATFPLTIEYNAITVQ